MDLRALVDDQTGLLSIDTDFFVQNDERRLAVELENVVARAYAAGASVSTRDDHVDLVELVSEPFDVVVNFDTHMDLSLEFLLGAAPHVPPQDATVFETILTAGRARRYVWAHPMRRGRDAARVYAAATLAARQPVLPRVHCLGGPEALALLDRIHIAAVFVCRSPAYATAETEAAFRRLAAITERQATSAPRA